MYNTFINFCDFCRTGQGGQFQILFMQFELLLLNLSVVFNFFDFYLTTKYFSSKVTIEMAPRPLSSYPSTNLNGYANVFNAIYLGKQFCVFV